MRSTMDMILAEEARIDRILQERTAIPEQVLADRKNGDVFFTAHKALEFGLVHDLTTFALPTGNKVFHL